MYLLLRILAMSSKDIDVGLPDVGPSGLGLDEVVPGGVKVGTHLGMTTRSMARGVDNDGIIDPEDSVSNLGLELHVPLFCLKHKLKFNGRWRLIASWLI